jgi:hypothetical protein
MRNPVTAYAETAYEALRALNHVTYPGQCELTDPADACTVVALLESAIYTLPQALRQLGDWLTQENSAGRVRVVAGPYREDRDLAVAAAQHYLIRAGGGLRQALDCLDSAHTILGDLAAPDPEQMKR